MPANNSLRQFLAWIAVLLLLAVTAWFGWKALRDTKPEAMQGGPGGARPPRTVIVRPAEAREMVQFLPVTGTLRAVRRAEVAARESAAVEAIAVDEGDLVEAGAIIARLDTRRLDALSQEATAALTAARAELTQREAEHQRAIEDEAMMRGLWDQRAIAEREYLDAVRELKVAAARENAARESIQAASKRFDLLEVRRADLEIKAPFDGRVVARHTELGEWLQEGDPVVTLLSTGEVEAWLQLPERHVALLRATSPEGVNLTFPGINEPIRADKLSLVPDVEGRSRSFQLIAHIPDPENKLTPGSSVEASVPLGTPERRLVISADAVLLSYAGTYVFVPETSVEGPPMAKRVPVEVLFERNGEAVLAPGALQEGDQVIVEGNERLFPNTPLDPKPWSETRKNGPSTASPVE
jgi:RND family efflux transporter MFP subunit